MSRAYRVFSRLGLAVLVAALAAGAGLMLAASPEDLLNQARQQYQKHNYEQAAELSRDAIKANPSADLAAQARRLEVMSACGLRDDKAEAEIQDVFNRWPDLKKDAEFNAAAGDYLADCGMIKRAYEAFVRAAEAYEAADQFANAADVWLKAASQLQRDYSAIARPEPTTKPTQPVEWTRQDQQRLAARRGVEICERVAAMKPAQVDADRRGSALLFGGNAWRGLGDWESGLKAIALWRRCVKEVPAAAATPNAQFAIANTLEAFGKSIEAMDEYAKVIQDYPKHDLAEDARHQIQYIKDPQIVVTTVKPYLPDEKVPLYWQIRNVKKLHLTAHAVDLVKAIEQGQLAAGDLVDTAKANKGEQLAEWEFQTPDEGKHFFHVHFPPEGQEQGETPKQTTLPIDLPVKKPGAYLVTAEGANAEGKRTVAHCIVLISRLGAVAKLDGDKAIVFANDLVDGKPAQGAATIVRRQWHENRPVSDSASGTLNDAGLAELKFRPRREASWIAAVKRDDQQALVSRGDYSWYWWGYGGNYKVYGFTDRPVYRPKSTVHFKETVRRNQEGKYTNLPNQKVRVEITNPKGETIYAKDHVTDEFGSLTGSVAVGDNAPLGVYQITVRIGKEEVHYYYAQGNQFRVEEYKKPEFKVSVEPGQQDYRIGDDMKIKIAARYYFGQAVAGAEVNYTIRKQSYYHSIDWPRPWEWRWQGIRDSGPRHGDWSPWHHPRFDELVSQGQIKTDSGGEAFVIVKAEAIKGHEKLDLKFVVSCEVTDTSRRVIRGGGDVKVTHAPFFISCKPAQAVYGPGDSVEVEVKTEDPNRKPVAGKFTAEAWRIERIRKVVKEDGNDVVEFEEKLAQKAFGKEIEIPATGRTSVRFTPDMTGEFKIIVKQAAGDKGRAPVEGSCNLWVAGKTGAESHYAYSDLKLIPSSDQYEIGQTMKVLVTTNRTGRRVLLTGEADVLLFTQVVHVEKNSKMVELPVTPELCPNFTLTATLLADDKLFMDSKPIVVPPTHRFIDVKVSYDKGDKGGGDANRFQPGEKTKVRVKATDRRTGKPVSAQLALMMVDSSVYYIQPEFRDAIEEAFYGQTRQVRVSTGNSYHGPPSVNPGVGGHGGGGRDRWFDSQGGDGGPEGALSDAAPGAAGGFRMQQCPDPALPAMAAARPTPSAKSAEAAEAPPTAEAVVRKEFRDTVLWAGSVVTDADGAAAVEVAMPDQLTTFALHAIAIDKDTRVGQVQSEAITTKRIVARLEGGRFFTEGDKSWVTVIAHNYYDEPQKLWVDLAVTDGLQLGQVQINGKWQDYKPASAIEVAVPAGGEQRMDFLTTALRPGEVKMTARVRGQRESDAIELTKPILPWGARKLESRADVLKGKADDSASTFEIEIPKDIKSGSQELTILLNPSVASAALEALPFLAEYPYGCVEQTMSRFLPTVLMRKTAQDLGIDLAAVKKRVEQQAASDPKLAARWKLLLERMHRNPVYDMGEVDRMIGAGLKRLADMQHADGSWGWWKNSDGDPYMTAYVLHGLLVARDCDVKVSPDAIERATGWLTGQAAKPKVTDDNWWWRHLDNDNSRVFMLSVIGRAKPSALKEPKLAAHIERIWKARDGLTDYGRAYLALTLQAAERKDDARTVVENFQNTAQLDEKAGTAGWGKRDGWWYWYDGADETTAWVLQAMLSIDPDNKHVPMAVKYLLLNRRGEVWGNTKATAMAVMALARYAKQAGELDCDQTFEIVAGGVTQTVKVTRENLFSFDDRLVIAADQLPAGKHKVTIRRKGTGSLYWAAHLRYFSMAEQIKAGGNQIAVARKYFRLVPEQFQNTRNVWNGRKYVEEKFPDIRYKKEPLDFGAEIASGQQVEVELTIDADNNFEYLVFEDPKPAGCEPYQLVSGAAYGGGTYANMELRDTKVVFFADWLGRGKHNLSYKLVCEQPGTFRILPSKGEAMYTPFVEAISDSGKMVITDRPAK
jgi:hypothetical protein